MDLQIGSQPSAPYSLDNALESVSQDLVYDPTTKQLCIRSQSFKNGSTAEQRIRPDPLEPDPKRTLQSKLSLNELRKQSDSDSGYCGLSSDSNTENGSQKSISDTRSDLYPEINENVDDLNLSCDLNSDSGSRLGKSKLFIQSVLTKLTSTIASTTYDATDESTTAKQLGHGSFSSTASSLTSISDCIDDCALTLAKRPSNLPPKSEEEQRRHQTEINEILKHAKKRELKSLKLKKRALSKKFRQEDVISGAIRSWTQDILPTWPSSNATKRARELWWSGIPSPIRSKVWSLAIGNELRITDELFRICVERSKERVWTKQFICRRSSNPYPASSVSCAENLLAKQHRRVSSQPIATRSSTDALCVEKLTKKLSDVCIKEGVAECAKSVSDSEEDEEDKSESIAYLIKLDVSRTFPQLGLFQEGGPYHQSLSDVLAAYVVYRPDLGYCQGMSFLAAMLLLNLDSAASCFTAFANLLNRYELLQCFYRLDQAQMQTVYAYYERQLQATLPRLASHLRAIGFTVDLFLVDQIYTLLSRSLPLDCVCRVWDVFLRDGDAFLFRASLGLLALYEDTLLGAEFVQVAQFLARLPEEINIEHYFEAIAVVKLAPPHLFQHDNPDTNKATDAINLSLAKKLLQLR